jgi:hypothetical protein
MCNVKGAVVQIENNCILKRAVLWCEKDEKITPHVEFWEIIQE